MKRDLRKATAEVLSEQKDALLDQVEATIALVTLEAKKSKKVDEKARALEAKQLLEAAVDIAATRAKTEPLTKEEAVRLLQALDLSNRTVTSLEQDNRSKGYDGQTFTDRRLAVNKELATKQQIIALLTEIREKRDAAREESKKSMSNVRETFAKGFTSFLGPAGPIVELFTELKKEHGEDARTGIAKLKRLVGLQRDANKEFDLQNTRAASRQEHMFDMLGQQFKRLQGVLGASGGGAGGSGGNGKGGLFDNILDRIGGGGKNGGRGKPGRIGRAAKSILGKGKSFLGRGARAVGSMIGRRGASLIPGLGAAVGIYGLATTEGSKDSDTAGDRAMAYGEGALNGATAGAGIGALFGGIGAVPGAIIGAAVGTLLTGVVRNWSTIKDSTTKSLDFVAGLMGRAWRSAKDFSVDATEYAMRTWRSTKSAVGDIYDWLKHNLPGFATVSRIATAVGGGIVGGAVTAARAFDSATTKAGTAITQATQNLSLGGGAGSDAYTKGADANASYNANNKSTGGNANSVAKFVAPPENIRRSIVGAADSVGVDRGLALSMINAESSFRPNAGAGTSSAQGLGQFTDAKWSDMVRKYGREHGIGMGDRLDPDKNAKMTALLIRDNQAALKRDGLGTGGADVYALHFMGDSGGKRFLQALRDTPNADGAAMFPAAAKANYNVFYNKDGRPKTLREIYGGMQAKIDQPAAEYNASMAPSTESQSRVASVTPGANVRVAQSGTDSTASGSGAGGGAGAGRGSQGTGRTTRDIPVVLGDNNMIVVNNGMMG